MRIRAFIFALLFLTPAAFANNIDLSTVPKRDSVQLTIYNSEDLTLVRETRTITFKQGENPLQFSWANTLIDPTSVQLRFLEHAGDLEVLDTTYPHDKPQMLYWNVDSKFAGSAAVEITYFTSGITWKADYTCIADPDEKQVDFQGFVRIYNNSGEEYEDAQVRLVVGTINLVEKIAELAHMDQANVTINLKLDDMKKDKEEAILVATNMPAPTTQPFGVPEPKKIIKEGLSEYFIFTIEGTETIENGWSKRLRAIEPATVPLKIQYRYRPLEYGEDLVRMYLMTNDKDSKLGATPLPDGIVRVFRQNGRDGLSYLGQQAIKYIPIGDKIELNLGPDPNVVFELIKLHSFRDNIWLQGNGVNVYQCADDGAVKIQVNSHVAGWDDHAVYAQRIRNYTAKQIDVKIRRTCAGDAAFLSKLSPTQFDFQTAQFQATVDPAARSDLLFETITHQGYLSHQNHLELRDADVKQ